MVGDRGLGQTHDGDDLFDAPFPFGQQLDDLQASRMGQGAEDPDRRHRRGRARLLWSPGDGEHRGATAAPRSELLQRTPWPRSPPCSCSGAWASAGCGGARTLIRYPTPGSPVRHQARADLPRQAIQHPLLGCGRQGAEEALEGGQLVLLAQSLEYPAQQGVDERPGEIIHPHSPCLEYAARAAPWASPKPSPSAPPAPGRPSYQGLQPLHSLVESGRLLVGFSPLLDQQSQELQPFLTAQTLERAPPRSGATCFFLHR